MAGKRPTGLGRGLSALMADVPAVSSEEVAQASEGYGPLPIELVYPNPDQPRKDFDQDELLNLTASVREKGILQPLVVRVRPSNSGQYEIVAGERRWRAAQMAGLHQVPAIIRNFTDVEVLEIAIVENIQRADLNPIEEAAGYQRLLQEFGHTQEELAKALGKSRSHITNLLRLLNLPEPVAMMVRKGELSMGHARALLASEAPLDLAQRIVKEGLSVRETEKIVKAGKAPTSKPSPTTDEGGRKSADTRALENDLSAALGMSVKIDHDDRGHRGRVSIQYQDLDQLDQICALLSRFTQ